MDLIIVNKEEWLGSPANINDAKILGWKVHKLAKSFVLRSWL